MNRFYDINDRVRTVALYVADTKCTVRNAASHFGISKSTIHKDLTCTLPKTDRALYLRVKEVLEMNKSERHFRGGEATRLKYLKKRMEEK